jgi:hypothetical protein
MKKWVLGLLVLYVLDTVLTYAVLTSNLSHEYNPIVNLLFSIHPGLFLLVKSIIAFAIASYSDEDLPKPIQRWIKALAFLYAIIVVDQIIYLGYLIAQ